MVGSRGRTARLTTAYPNTGERRSRLLRNFNRCLDCKKKQAPWDFLPGRPCSVLLCRQPNLTYGFKFLATVDLLLALIVALRRYKQMAASQKCGDIFLPFLRNRCYTTHQRKFGGWPHRQKASLIERVRSSSCSVAMTDLTLNSLCL
jgi:hypothetical protein